MPNQSMHFASIAWNRFTFRCFPGLPGPFRYEAFLGDLKGWVYPNEPWVQAQKFSFKPTKIP
jgi:hypothetical protein